MYNTQNDPRAFRNALGQFPTGVTVITTLDGGGNRVGMTANSFSSVSLDPMLVLWSIAKTASAYDAFMQAKHFAIHVLSADQESTSQRFSAKDGDRFAGLDCENGHGGVPLLPEFAARFECTLESCYAGGDHDILVGRVEQFAHRDCIPLGFHAGRYINIPDFE
ncbi:MAG: flavin reductase family protein [Gammaproteobacteria bacterium]|nr:flavin reductase family protein [Gammaproteobacteria bacterium]RZV60054.1 MAG: flavin reductase [Pseudomonadales bacterium]